MAIFENSYKPKYLEFRHAVFSIVFIEPGSCRSISLASFESWHHAEKWGPMLWDIYTTASGHPILKFGGENGGGGDDRYRGRWIWN